MPDFEGRYKGLLQISLMSSFMEPKHYNLSEIIRKETFYNSNSTFLEFFFFLAARGFELRAYMLSRQGLYHFTHSTIPVLCWVFSR
jgi:hypothetical protein